MTTAIGSVPSVSYVPLPQGVTDPAPDAAQSPPDQSAPAAPAPASGPAFSDATLGALVAQQDVATPAPTAGPLDLRGQDLRIKDLSNLDLRGANLSGANLSGMDLSGLDLTGAVLSGATLSGATLTNAKLDNVSAEGADLSGAVLSATTMDGADFANANFDKARILQSATGPTGKGPTVASNVRLDGASFKGATINEINFTGGSAVGADFSELNAVEAYFTTTNLQGATFDKAGGLSLYFHTSDLTNASLTNMSDTMRKGIVNDDLTGTKFAGSSFDNTGIGGVALSQADLSGIVRSAKHSWFNVANYSGVDFSGFNFVQTIFDGSPGDAPPDPNLKFSVNGASFAGATFSGVQFVHTDLSGGDFHGAVFNHVNFQSGDPGALAGSDRIEFGVNISADTDVAINGASPFGPKLSNQALADMLAQPAVDGSASVAAVGSTARTDPNSDASVAALDTLQRVSDQLRQARNGDTVGDHSVLSLFQRETV